jgi:hypothetical protein
VEDAVHVALPPLGRVAQRSSIAAAGDRRYAGFPSHPSVWKVGFPVVDRDDLDDVRA